MNAQKSRSGKAGLARRVLSVFLTLVMLVSLAPSALAYNALGPVDSIVLEKNGRQITYYDIHGGEMENRTDPAG